MFRKILLLVGPQTSIERAGVTRTAELAQRTGAAIELLTVVYEPHLEGYFGHPEMYESLRDRVVEEQRVRVETLAGQLASRGLRCEAKAVWEHPTHMAIVRAAADPDIDLVVLEPEDNDRGLSHDEWRLISICPAPVLVARSEPVVPYETIVAAVDPQRSHGKPAELDLDILKLAKGLRDACRVPLEVVHCIPPLATFVPYAAVSDALRQAEEVMRSNREQELEALLRQAGLPPESAALIDGKPADVLAEKSASETTSVTVVGTVSRGPIARLLIGSTAERILRGTGGDVLVIRPPGFGLTSAEGAA